MPEAPWEASLIKRERDVGALNATGEGVRRVPDPMASGSEFIPKTSGVDLCPSHFQLREDHEQVHALTKT